MIKTLGLTHLGLAVRDLERSLRFYQAVFGSQVLHRSATATDINTPGCRDIITLTTEDADAAGTMAGVAHFGFRLTSPDDADAAADEIERAGGVVVSRGEFVPGEPYIFAKDPDGYVIEIWYELEGQTGPAT
jgi:catechol 2,3-dioxygenase-like lactoylglutathione lyase family enzyme